MKKALILTIMSLTTSVVFSIGKPSSESAQALTGQVDVSVTASSSASAYDQGLTGTERDVQVAEIQVNLDHFPVALDPSSFSMTSQTLTSAETVEHSLNILENFVALAEQHWEANPTFEPNGGRFKASGSGVKWARGNGNIALVYAVLLKGRPDQQFFSNAKIPRAQLEDHLVRTVRFIAQSYSEESGRDSGTTWGPGWQVALEGAFSLWASVLQEDLFDAETLALLEKSATAAADSLDKTIPVQMHGDSKSEDGTWNTVLLALVANRYADDPRAEKWDMLAKKWAMNALSRPQDLQEIALIDGKLVNEWVVGANVFPDLTIENHNMWSTGYQIQCQFFTEGMLAYTLFGQDAPEAYAYHQQEMWDNVTKALYLWDGDMMLPTGQDWAWKAYNNTQYLTMMRLFFDRPEAGAFESRAIQMMLKRQLAVGTGGFATLNFGFSTVSPKRLAFTCLAHMMKPEPKGQSISMKDAYPSTEGSFVFPYVKVGIHRTEQKCVSVSWHHLFQPIYVFPEGDSTYTSPPFFIPYDRFGGGVTLTEEGVDPKTWDQKFKKSRGWKACELVDVEQTDTTLDAVYVRHHVSGILQMVGVASLADEATVIVTEFIAEKDGTYGIEKLLSQSANTIQGFPLDLQVTRGTNWINWTDHLAFVSTEPLPNELPKGTFYAAKDRLFTVKAGEAFGRTAVAIYARQPNEKTKAISSLLRFVDAPKGNVAVELESSSGKNEVSLVWPKERYKSN